MSERETALKAVELLRRLRGWDMFDATADGPYWKREIDAALAGADPVPVCQWREIATAPKDGTRVLVMWEYWSADPFVAYFKHGRWNGEVALSECSDDGPTHWMPLPAPPVALVPAEGDR